MIRFIFCLFVLVLPTSVLAQACGTTDLIAGLSSEDRARLDALVAPHPYPEGNIWRARKGVSNVTVVGTIHIPDPRLSALVETVRSDVESADLLIIESSLEDESGIQRLVAEKPELFFITEGPTLIDLLGDEEWGRVSEQLFDMGIPSFFAAKFQPWYLSMTLAIPPCAMASLQSGGKGLDRQLEAIANASGKPIATLDDVEAVLKLFADEPLEKQLDGLRVTLETQTGGEEMTSTLIEGYFDGRAREVWEYGRILIEEAGIENGAALYEEMNQALLIGRNKDWEPKIAALVAGKNAVLAVGAAHLSGESGVLRALERAGYTLEPIE